MDTASDSGTGALSVVVEGFSRSSGTVSGRVAMYQSVLLNECPDPPADEKLSFGISRAFCKANSRWPTVARIAYCRIDHPCSVQLGLSSQLCAKKGYN